MPRRGPQTAALTAEALRRFESCSANSFDYSPSPIFRAIDTVPHVVARIFLWLAVAVVAHVFDVVRAQPVSIAESVSPSVPTPAPIVDEILKLAEVGPGDYVIDLGSGDGRIVIAAVAKYRARGGLGVDIIPEAVALSNENAATAGVTDRVRFQERDLFATDVREATVVTIYLLPSIMGRVERKLRAELKPGARVVVHDFPFPDWRPEKTMLVESVDKLEITGSPISRLYLYRVPERR